MKREKDEAANKRWFKPLHWQRKAQCQDEAAEGAGLPEGLGEDDAAESALSV